MIPSFLNDALGFNLNRAVLLFRRELVRALEEYGMTPEQWMIMAALWTTGRPINQSEIAQLTMKDKHSVSRIIQRLERDGWIDKKNNPHDARITIIRPTKKGQSLKEKVPERLNEHFEKILSDFGEKEWEELIVSLKRLRKTLGDD